MLTKGERGGEGKKKKNSFEHWNSLGIRLNRGENNLTPLCLQYLPQYHVTSGY